MNRRLIELREVITKLVPMLAGRGLRVTQIGRKAYVKTDPRTRKPVIVNIPMIPDNAEESFIEAIQGFIDHEIGHVLITDWNYYAGGPSAEELRDPKVQAFSNTHNIVEDTMIEKEIVRIFPGSESNIARLRKHFVERITKPAVAAAKDEKEKFLYLLVPVMRALAGHKEFQEYLDENKLWEQPFVKHLVDQFTPDYLKRLRAATSTKETLELARELHDILYPPPPPTPPAAATGDMSAAISEPDDDDDEQPEPDDEDDGESQDKPEKKAEEGDGDGERDHSDQDDEGEEGPSDDEGDAGGDDEPDEDDGSEDGDEDDGDADADEKDEAEDGDEPSDDDEPGDGSSEENDDEDGESGDKDSEKEQEEDEGEEGAGSDGADEGEDDPEEGNAASGADDEDDDDEGDAAGSDGDDEDDGDQPTGSAGSGEESDDEDEGEASGEPGDGVNENQDPESAELEDIDPEGNGGGVGTSSSKSMFDFTDDAFDNADLSSAVQEIISKEIEGILDDKAQYIPLTRDLDEITHLVPPENINGKWVPEMEQAVAHMTGRMQKDIERIMASQSHVHYTPGHKTGKLHGPSLFRVSQGDPRVFRQKEEHVSKDTAVTLLIDNSGSMSGTKMRVAMMAGFALSSTLDRVKIAHEVLGFTTGHRGNVPQAIRDAIQKEFEDGKAYRIYDRTEPIVMPIYKDFDERLSPLVKKRIAYAMNAQHGLAGNIDGESVEYAAMRLMKRMEKRKVMLVLSDGQPAGGRLCQPHLRSVIKDCETKYGIETIGIGIMDSSVSRFYPKHVVLRDVNDLPGQVMTEIKKLLI